MDLLPAELRAFAARAPMAAAGRAIFEHLFRADSLDAWFRGRAFSQYERELTFSSLVELMAAVTFRRQASVRKAYMAEPGHWAVSLSAVYQKLQGVEPALCAALVADTSVRLHELIADSGSPPDTILPGRRVMGVDGSHAAATDHRLKVLRSTNLAALPCHALVVRDYQTGLLSTMVPGEDAHANERTLIPALFDAIRPNDVWLGDRNFATADLMAAVIDCDAAFVVRRHAKTVWRETSEYGEVSTLASGDRIDECDVVVVTPKGRELSIRLVRIRFAIPLQNGDQELFIFTNLPKEEVSAVQVAALYRSRWMLEGAFQVVEETMHGEVKSLGYPKAALFAMALSLVAYNIVVTLKRFAAAALKVTPDEVSDDMVATEIQTVTTGMMIAVPGERWNLIGWWDGQELARWLTRLMEGLSPTKYRKTKRGPKKPKKLNKSGSSGHVSTHRLLHPKAKAPKKSP
jgi:Transposase DDE domain